MVNSREKKMKRKSNNPKKKYEQNFKKLKEFKEINEISRYVLCCKTWALKHEELRNQIMKFQTLLEMCTL
jgi:superfamily I DNA and/or RNA helicase